MTASACFIASSAIAIPAIGLSFAQTEDRSKEFLRMQKELIETVQFRSRNIIELLVASKINMDLSAQSFTVSKTFIYDPV